MISAKRDWRAAFDEIRYLSLVTGQGARDFAAQKGWKARFATGPRDWAMTWDLELSVWEFRKRPPGGGGASPLAIEGIAASPEGPGA